ncbi:MAG TPA: diguanylate cyclase [Polyangiaceae bacterium]|nr:diguanylate cyclase [Polyangiaceae bacterium]
MQISSKVALSISLVVAVVGAAGSVLQLREQEEVLREEFRQTNEDAVELLALSIASAVDQGRHERVQAVLDNISNFKDRFEGVERLDVVSRDKRIVASLDPTRFNEIATDPQTLDHFDAVRPTVWWEDDDDALEMVLPIRLKHPLGVIRVSLKRQALQDTIDDQRLRALRVSALMLCLIALVLLLVHRHLVGSRLSELAKAAASLGAGNLDVRAEIDGKDEIAELGESFNAMANAIQLYTDDLEHIIDERTDELQQANKRLEQLATTDQLTGVWNRRYFDDAARRALEVARRNERPLCIALVDTDEFKSINDTWGHPVGDEVLKAVAKVLEENSRDADLVARVGGEEFAILMPEVGLGLAGEATERLRAALEADVANRVTILGDRKVTASFGVAAFEKADDRLEDLLSAADQAMYKSKTEGRNRVTLANRASAESEGAAPLPSHSEAHVED